MMTLDARLNDPATLTNICAHVSNGGSLLELCELWLVRYSDVVTWIYDDHDRRRLYDQALAARGEWFVQAILREFRALGTVDIRQAYDDAGRLLPMAEMPPDVARAISSVETFEEFSGKGEDRELIGYTKRVKFWDKPRALETLGKHLRMFVDLTEHSGKVTLESLIASSHAPAVSGSATLAVDAVADDPPVLPEPTTSREAEPQKESTPPPPGPGVEPVTARGDSQLLRPKNGENSGLVLSPENTPNGTGSKPEKPDVSDTATSANAEVL